MLLLPLLALLAISPSDAISAGTQLHYRGRFVAEKGELAASEKQFEVIHTIVKGVDGATSSYWTTEERGRGGWPWPDRFGKWELSDRLRPNGGTGPSLSYERPEGVSVVALQPPFLTYSEPFAAGVTWFEGTLEFRVAGEEKAGETDCWRIDVRSPIGRKRTVWVDKASPVVIALVETVFIGQGEQHDLRWELVARQTPEAAQAAATSVAFEEFLRLRERLGMEPQNREIRWTAERLGILKADLPAVAEKAKGTPLAKLAQSAEQDAKNQKERAGALGALQTRMVGRVSPQPAIETIAGEKFAWQDLRGKVTILHFWDYRDAPLEEPYGQVAYLDFLARQNVAEDVKIFGVIADERVTQPETKRSGVQSAKRLQSFMNLSYPLLVDAGSGIKEFGDPRAAGSKLPLFVVIDQKGNIIHYHAGNYEVHRDRGLEELANVVKQALGKRG